MAVTPKLLFMMAQKSKSPSRPKEPESIADIWISYQNPSVKPTYIIHKERLVTINQDECKTSEDAVRLLKQRVNDNIRKLKENGIEVKEVYIGKTYVLKKGSPIANAKNPDNWDTTGLSSRWSTSHSKPKKDEIQGKRNMIVLTTAITEKDVPDDIKDKYAEDSKKGECVAEYYTLELEQELIKELDTKQSEKGGKVGENLGYALYMRITHRKILNTDEQKVRSISICCFALHTNSM